MTHSAGYSEDALIEQPAIALFDLLTKPTPTLTKRQEADIKQVACDLLATLKREKLVLDWRSRLQTRPDVRETIETFLDQLPESAYPQSIHDPKCNLTYQHIFESYPGH